MRGFTIIAGFFVLVCVPSVHSQQVRLAKPQEAMRYGKLPLRFEENRGQTDPRVKFISHGSGYTLFLTPEEATFKFQSLLSPPHDPLNVAKRTDEMAVVRMKLLGGNPNPTIGGADRLSGTSNYFIGSDPQKWHVGIPGFSKAEYANVYPGIDLLYHGTQQQLEFDFIIAAGADPKPISFAVDGASRVSIDEAGELNVITDAGTVQLKKPSVYQVDHGVRKFIEGHYVLRGPHAVGVTVAKYNPAQALIIDPVLSYSTYLGGSGLDASEGIEVDASGNAYVSGWTTSSDFPTTGTPISSPPSGGGTVGFVVKLNNAGTGLDYATYLVSCPVNKWQ